MLGRQRVVRLEPQDEVEQVVVADRAAVVGLEGLGGHAARASIAHAGGG